MATNESTLLLVQIVFRHGIRAPDHKITYPGDPYAAETFAPFGKGQLTKTGRLQSYEFGKELRERYGHFLPSCYHEDESILEARATCVRRARDTLQLVLAGLFPPTPATRITDDLNWQPIAVDYAPNMRADSLLGPILLQVIDNQDQPDFGACESSKALIEHIRQHIGFDIKRMSQVMWIYDTIRSQVDLGFAVPAWARDIYPDAMLTHVRRYIDYNFTREGYVRTGGGMLAKHLVCNMEERTKRLALFSAHDVNIVVLLKMLDAFIGWPQYMASLAFELHRIRSALYVRIVYVEGYTKMEEMHSSSREPRSIPAPSGGDMWLLADFIDKLSAYFPQV